MNRPTARAASIAGLLFLVAAAAYFLLTGGSSIDAPPAEPRSGAAATSPAQAPVLPEAGAAADATAAPALAERAPAAAEQAAAPLQRLSGTAVDAASRLPLAGVRVALVRGVPPMVERGLTPPTNWPKQSARLEPLAISEPSAADGRFSLVGAELTGYLAPATAELAATRAVYVDAAAGASDAAALRLELAPAGTLSGSVRTHAGSPCAGAEIRLEVPAQMDIAFSGTMLLQPIAVRTAADGTFALESIPAGHDLECEVRAQGLPTLRRRVRAEPGRTVDLEFVLDPGTFVAGAVVDPRGAPVANARVAVRNATVRVSGASPNEFAVDEVEAATGADGRFRATGVIAGEYHVDVYAAGFTPHRRKRIAVPAEGLELAEPLVLAEGLAIRGVALDDRGQPVPGARIGIQKPMPMMPGVMVTPDGAEDMGGSTAVANERGEFATLPLADGAYDLAAEAKGHAKATAQGVRAGATGVELLLRRCGAIEGIAVSLADGEPIPRFRVAATRPIDFSGMLDPTSLIPGGSLEVAAADGRFRLEDVAPGTWSVTVAAPGHARGSAAGIEVPPGEVVRGVILMLAPECAIAGRVVDPLTGLPVPGARVTTRTGFEALLPDPLPGADATCDAAGAFELGGIASGRYVVHATAKGYAPGASPALVLAEHQRIDGIEIALPRGGSIRGRVARADDRPTAGAMVSATRIGDMRPNLTTTDDAGRYALEGLPAGKYSVTRLQPFGLDDGFAEDLFSGMSIKSARVVDGEVTEVDFLDAAAGGTRLEGRVLEGGEPVAGAILSFTPTGRATGADADLAKLKLATADERGQYEVENLGPGEWSVTVQAGQALSNALRQSFELTVPAQAEHHRDFEIEPSGIAGTIRARRDGTPIKGVRVSVDAVDPGAAVDAFMRKVEGRRVAESFTDAEGRYRVRGLAPGSYSVTAGGTSMFGIGAAGFARSTPRAAVVERDRRTDGVDLELEPGGIIAGAVTNEFGAAVQGASLFFVDASGAPSTPFSETLSDSSGGYRADGLAEGSFAVVAKAAGYAPAVETGVRVRASEETAANFRLVRGGELTVRVVLAGGTPTAAKVRLFEPGGLELSQFFTLEDLFAAGASEAGVYALGPVAPGLYQVRAESGSTSTVVEVQHGGSAEEVTIALP